MVSNAPEYVFLLFEGMAICFDLIYLSPRREKIDSL